MKSIRLILKASIAASAMALLAGTALAQSGAGAGGPAATPAMPASGMGMGPGMGSGMGMGRGHMAQWGMDYTPGWSMMTRAERNEHREHMRAFKTYEECTAYRDQVHEKMAARIKEKGGKPLAQPRRDACAGLKP